MPVRETVQYIETRKMIQKYAGRGEPTELQLREMLQNVLGQNGVDAALRQGVVKFPEDLNKLPNGSLDQR